MLCEICGKEEGRIKYTKVINGEKIEFYICEKCAKEKGFLSLIAESEKDETLKENKDIHTIECSFCRKKWIDIERDGKFGCPQCYSTFRPFISKLLAELNGGEKHKGKIPIVDKQILFLKRKIRETKMALDDAIDKEEYELAATLRDKIKSLSIKINIK